MAVPSGWTGAGANAIFRIIFHKKRDTRVITIGTIFSTLFCSEMVGTEEFGNKYYRA